MAIQINSRAVDTIYYGSKKILSVYNKDKLVYLHRREYSGTNDIYIAYDTGVSNGAKYTFYNSSGTVVSPTPGTAIRSYTIEGSPKSDRFYCAYSLSGFYGTGQSWSSNLYGTNIGTSTGVGTGRANTELGKAKNTDSNSIFALVKSMNDSKVYGYADWYIPSYNELTSIYNVLPNAKIWNKDDSQDDGSGWAIGIKFWTSSEYDANEAYMWVGYYSDTPMIEDMFLFASDYKNITNRSDRYFHTKMLPIRSF